MFLSRSGNCLKNITPSTCLRAYLDASLPADAYQPQAVPATGSKSAGLQCSSRHSASTS